MSKSARPLNREESNTLALIGIKWLKSIEQVVCLNFPFILFLFLEDLIKIEIKCLNSIGGINENVSGSEECWMLSPVVSYFVLDDFIFLLLLLVHVENGI